MKALIIVDVQNDFLPGGALAVPNGDEVIPVINSIVDRFDLVLATQDWHPWNHKSFASNNYEKAPFEMGELNGAPQMMWPDHCVQMTTGAQLANKLDQRKVSVIFRKGMDPEVDSYSGFMDNDFRNHTGLEDYLDGMAVRELYICGLATDYCVKFTAEDANDLLCETTVSVITDACRGIGDIEKTFENMKNQGIFLINSNEIKNRPYYHEIGR